MEQYGAFDYREEWENYWSKEGLTPAIGMAKVRRVDPEVFEEGDTVIINTMENPQNFIGVIVYPQAEEGYYLNDPEGDIPLSDLLPNYDIDECLVHYQSIKAAESTTDEEISPRTGSQTMESQRERSLSPLIRSQNNIRCEQGIHSNQLWQQINSVDSMSGSQISLEGEGDIESLKAENVHLKKEVNIGIKELQSTRGELDKCKKELSVSNEKLQSSNAMCNSLQKKIMDLENKGKEESIKITKLESELTLTLLQKNNQKQLISQFCLQRIQSVSNIKEERNELRKKITVSENKFIQAMETNRALQRQIVELKGNASLSNAGITSHNLGLQPTRTYGRPSLTFPEISADRPTYIEDQNLRDATQLADPTSNAQEPQSRTKGPNGNSKSALEVDVIERVCKSVVSPFAEMAKNYRDGDAQLAKDRVTFVLTAALMRAGKGKGLNNVIKWIKAVENSAGSDSLRIQMVRLKADPDVLCLINVKEMELLNMTWDEIKALLTAKATKATMWEATDELLEHTMKESDDICAFSSRLRTDYDETCKALGVTKLRKSFEEILSFTATCNMTRKARLMYAEPLINDCQRTVEEIEEASRDPTYKKSLFGPGSSQRILNQEATISGVNRGRSVWGSSDTKTHPNMAAVIQDEWQTSNIPTQEYWNGMPSPGESRQPFSTQAGREYDSFGQDITMVAAISNREQEKAKRNPYWQEKKTSYNRYQSNYPSNRNSPQRGDTQRSEKSEKRREALSQWFDWSCPNCKKHNSGRFCKCFYCGEQATPRQIPKTSWQCKNCAFGRNTWIGDHYCTSCLQANPEIPEDKRNKLPYNAEGYGRSSKWTPIEPAISPQE